MIRAFDYSTASTHNNNAPVINNVAAAWYHNATAKEVEAIEAWLKANPGFLPSPGANGSLLVSNGTTWISFPGNTLGTNCFSENATGTPNWTTCGGGGGGGGGIIGTATLGTSLIASGSCASVVTVAAAGITTSSTLSASFASNPTGVTGYMPGAMLSIVPYPTTDSANFLVCNKSPLTT